MGQFLDPETEIMGEKNFMRQLIKKVQLLALLRQQVSNFMLWSDNLLGLRVLPLLSKTIRFVKFPTLPSIILYCLTNIFRPWYKKGIHMQYYFTLKTKFNQLNQEKASIIMLLSMLHSEMFNQIIKSRQKKKTKPSTI